MLLMVAWLLEPHVWNGTEVAEAMASVSASAAISFILLGVAVGASAASDSARTLQGGN